MNLGVFLELVIAFVCFWIALIAALLGIEYWVRGFMSGLLPLCMAFLLWDR